MKTMQAYKRSPALENSTWYKGLLISQLAGSADTEGAFDLVESKMKKGTEPPPHIHDREDELFYILSGEIMVFADGQVFTVAAGESVFLPKKVPHAYLIQSDVCHVLALIYARWISQRNQQDERTGPHHGDSVRHGNLRHG